MVEAQFALAVQLGFLHVHVEAEAAAVDLRGADVHEVEDLLLDGAVFSSMLNSTNFLNSSGDC